MNVAFVFNGALTAAQEKASAKGSVVSVGDYLNDFDLVVYGPGVVLPELDVETKPFAKYKPSSVKKKRSKKTAVKSNGD